MSKLEKKVTITTSVDMGVYRKLVKEAKVRKIRLARLVRYFIYNNLKINEDATI